MLIIVQSDLFAVMEDSSDNCSDHSAVASCVNV